MSRSAWRGNLFMKMYDAMKNASSIMRQMYQYCLTDSGVQWTGIEQFWIRNEYCIQIAIFNPFWESDRDGWFCALRPSLPMLVNQFGLPATKEKTRRQTERKLQGSNARHSYKICWYRFWEHRRLEASPMIYMKNWICPSSHPEDQGSVSMQYCNQRVKTLVCSASC